jgi:hypothetical protein
LRFDGDEEELPASSAAIYFRDISSTSLLTAEEEIVLAQQIEHRDDAKRLLERSNLSADGRGKLEQVAATGERARGQLDRGQSAPGREYGAQVSEPRPSHAPILEYVA